ncbi:MAG: DnaJ protein [Myxococcaceae bacterium]|nr:DnaJ protein [Myxococcaceae bacterium]
MGGPLATDVITGLGSKSDFIAAVPQVDVRRLALTPEEAALFSLVGRASQISEVIERSNLAEPRAIAGLLSLRAKGAIVPARVQKGVASSFDAALQEQVDLDENRKREILDFEAKLPGLNFFQLLGVANLASPDEARKSFHELARRFHPDRFYGKNLGSFRGRVENIFRKLTEANEVLGDHQRRTAYLAAHPELVDVPEPVAPAAGEAAPRQRTAVDDQRDAERRARLTRHPYLARTSKVNDLLKHARESLAKNEPSLAFNDLSLAARLDDKNAEVKALMVEVRKKHESARGEQELKKGKELLESGDQRGALSAFRTAASVDGSNPEANYLTAKLILATNGDLKEASSFAQRAVDAQQTSALYRELYGRILELAGMKALAKKQFEELLKQDPQNAEAKKQLKRRWPF